MHNKLKVLITRPEPACWQLQQALTAIDIDSCCHPLFDYKLNTSKDELLTINEKFDPQYVIFVSKAAVKFAAQALAFNEWLPKNTAAFAVGSATQDELYQHGIDAICPLEHTSEGLLALSQLQASTVSHSKIIIVRGDGGREYLASELNARGAKVRYLESYRRNWLEINPDQHKIWKSKQINAMVITSEALLKKLTTTLALDDYWFNDCRFVFPSMRIAKTAQALGYRNIFICSGASDLAIAETLKGMEI